MTVKRIVFASIALVVIITVSGYSFARNESKISVEGTLGLRKSSRHLSLVTDQGVNYRLNVDQCADLQKLGRTKLVGNRISVTGLVRGPRNGTITRRTIKVKTWELIKGGGFVLVPLKGGEVHGLLYVNAHSRTKPPLIKNPIGDDRKIKASVRKRITLSNAANLPTKSTLPDFLLRHAEIYLPAANTTRQIAIPDITVYLRNVVTNTTSPEVTTDVHGRYAVPRMPAGRYQICWKADGYVPGCTHEIIQITDKTVNRNPIAVLPKTSVIYGRVTLADKSVARFVDKSFGINVETTVSRVNPQGQSSWKVRTNVKGEYVLPEVPVGPVIIRANVETAVAKKSFNFGGGMRVLDLTFANRAPKIKAIYALQDGKGVRTANAGDSVDVRVEVLDLDDDKVTYHWRPNAAAGGLAAFTSKNDNRVGWKLGSSKALKTMYVIVGDSKGGYARAKLNVANREQGVLFTGKVSGDAPVVTNAIVSINGKTTTTNSAGYFSMIVEESGRYVINVRKLGYQLLSKITFEPIIDGRYKLNRAQKFGPLDPTKLIQIMEEPKNQDQRRPSILKIPPNSLVGPDGKPSTGPVEIYFSSIDIRDPEAGLPGDFTAINTDGNYSALTSYGAVQIDIVDLGGKRHNLAPGKTATIGIGVDNAQLSNSVPPPKDIELWEYDDKKGLWTKLEGKASISNSWYVAEVKSFSVINVDVEKEDAACMRLVTDTTRLTLPFDVRLTIPTGTGVDKVAIRRVADPLTAVIRLPPNENIQIEVLDSDGNAIAAATQTVNSGDSLGNALAPDYPYNECNSEAFLTFEAPADNGFLDYIGIDDAVTAEAYYLAIDPDGAKNNLDLWKSENGFDSGDDASAVYFNAPDLGFGRGMHMKQTGGDIAYYVSNHDTVDEARLNINTIATVAMEYSSHPVDGGARYVKFYVFQDRDLDGIQERVPDADLDDRGLKGVPRLCIICHGGNAGVVGAGGYPNNGDVSAQFIAFDSESYLYSDFENPIFSGNKPFGKEQQQDEFKLLNLAILDVDAAVLKPAINQLIEGWYAPALTRETQNEGFVPSGWINPVDKSGVYNSVVKTSCRVCHSSRDPGLDWTFYTNDGAGLLGFKELGPSIEFLICNLRKMPQARQTYLNFWLSTNPHRPSVMANAGLDGWGPGEVCPLP